MACRTRWCSTSLVLIGDQLIISEELAVGQCHYRNITNSFALFGLRHPEPDRWINDPVVAVRSIGEVTVRRLTLRRNLIHNRR